MLRAIVPLVGGEGFAGFGTAVVDEFIRAWGRGSGSRHRFASRNFPRLAAVAGALDDLPKPAAGLRGINAIGVGRGPLQVVQFPSRKERTANFPLVALAVRGQDKRPLVGPYQHSYAAHRFLLGKIRPGCWR